MHWMLFAYPAICVQIFLDRHTVFTQFAIPLKSQLKVSLKNALSSAQALTAVWRALSAHLRKIIPVEYGFHGDDRLPTVWPLQLQ